MAHRTRIRYIEEIKSHSRDEYQCGELFGAIGRRFHRPLSSIHQQLALTDGIRPVERKRTPI